MGPYLFKGQQPFYKAFLTTDENIRPSRYVRLEQNSFQPDFMDIIEQWTLCRKYTPWLFRMSFTC